MFSRLLSHGRLKWALPSKGLKSKSDAHEKPSYQIRRPTLHYYKAASVYSYKEDNLLSYYDRFSLYFTAYFIVYQDLNQ